MCGAGVIDADKEGFAAHCTVGGVAWQALLGRESGDTTDGMFPQQFDDVESQIVRSSGFDEVEQTSLNGMLER